MRFVLTSHYASYTLTVSIMYRQRNIEVDLFENTEILMRIQDSILSQIHSFQHVGDE